jgi:hypothetical protein
MELIGRPGPDVGLLYLGGPVDFNLEDHKSAWQHWGDWELTGLYPYCPRCECAGLTDAQIMEKNRRAVMRAKLAIFDLRSHSVGTPIEMYMRLFRREKASILIGSWQSVFIRVAVGHHGGILTAHPDAALEEALEQFGGRSRKQSPRGAKGKSR